jgi:CRISPR/Cas system-associated protein Cas5 (RAMP superfamily)
MQETLTTRLIKGERVDVWKGEALYCMINGRKHYKEDLILNDRGTIVSIQLQEKQKKNYMTNISIQKAFKEQAYLNRAKSLLKKAKRMEEKKIVSQVNKMLGLSKKKSIVPTIDVNKVEL